MAALEQSLQQYSQPTTGAPAAGAQNVPSPGFPRGQGGTETLIPQFGESFLDRLMQMSSRNEDSAFRQDLTNRLIGERFNFAALEREMSYYGSLRRSLSDMRLRGPGELPVLANQVEQSMKGAFEQVGTALDHVVSIYEQLSRNNLNPSTMLYTVTLPYTQQHVPAYTTRQATLWGVAIMTLASFVLALAVLIYDRFHPSRWRTASTESRPNA
ncbi:MAG: hypothetical protein FJW22_15635 [Acidimicrobiia bacterium]|nr:hypothetical protein [Acidimicrobiia bacterium]